MGSEGASGPEGARYPGYIVGGVISLGLAAAAAVGGGIGAATDSPKTTVGLLGLGTTLAATGVPLIMLGATDETPESMERAAAGIAIATPGVLSIGLGGTFWGARAAEDNDGDVAVPLVLIIGGAAATVGGIVLWSTGAGHADDVTATFSVGPTGGSLVGQF